MCKILTKVESNNLTQKGLKERFTYHPDTGLFTYNYFWQGMQPGTVAGSKATKGHQIKIRGVAYKTYRLAFLYMEGAFPENEVDHIDGDNFNDKWDNLRKCTSAENSRNCKLSINNTTGTKGVYWDKAVNKYRVKIMVDGVSVDYGRHSSLEEAIAIVTKAREQLHGEFACHSRKVRRDDKTAEEID